jgi:hypothetical protein
MTTLELKSEIRRKIDELPDDLLPYVLEYFKLVQRQSVDQVKLGKNIKKILVEDKALFERLA